MPDDKPRWQRAITIKAGSMPELVGRLVWFEIGRIEPCGGHGCTIPSIYVNHEFDSPFGPGQNVNHLDALEMLPEFADEVPMLTWSEFLAGKDDAPNGRR